MLRLLFKAQIVLRALVAVAALAFALQSAQEGVRRGASRQAVLSASSGLCSNDGARHANRDADPRSDCGALCQHCLRVYAPMGLDLWIAAFVAIDLEMGETRAEPSPSAARPPRKTRSASASSRAPPIG